ncbi:MAG: Lrp/AsnC family transcriptional regulator [Candidatus Bathyarchaeia archaeon]
MGSAERIDAIDAKILTALTFDARTTLKNIAKDCGISPNAVFKRVRRLERAGVIVGTTLFVDRAILGCPIAAQIGINLDCAKEEEIVKLLQNTLNLVDLSPTIGKYNLCAYVYAESLQELDEIKQDIRRRPGVTRATVNIWVRVHKFWHNLDLQPHRAEKHG